jgi:hypothetical protein
VIFASCLSVIWRVLFSVYQTSFLSVIFTSFILGFVQEVVSLLFGEFYSLCYFTSFGLGFGEFTLERIADRGPIVVLALVEGTSRTYDAIKVPQEAADVPQETLHVSQEALHVPQETPHEPQVIYSGDLPATFAAATFAFAFVVAWRSDADPFHTWAAWVTKVSPPLKGTSTRPVFADRVVLARSVLLSEKMIWPTWFLAPLPPSSLWKQLHVSAAMALTTILLALSRPAWASKSSILTWSRLLIPVMLRATLLKAT